MVSNVKQESLKHFTLKCLIYKRIKELNHNGNAEYNSEGSPGILDAVDWTTGLVYEVIHTKLSNESIKEKLEKYLKISGVRDVIFVSTARYSIRHSLKSWYKRVKELVI